MEVLLTQMRLEETLSPDFPHPSVFFGGGIGEGWGGFSVPEVRNWSVVLPNSPTSEEEGSASVQIWYKPLARNTAWLQAPWAQAYVLYLLLAGALPRFFPFAGRKKSK